MQNPDPSTTQLIGFLYTTKNVRRKTNAYNQSMVRVCLNHFFIKMSILFKASFANWKYTHFAFQQYVQFLINNFNLRRKCRTLVSPRGLDWMSTAKQSSCRVVVRAAHLQPCSWAAHFATVLVGGP